MKKQQKSKAAAASKKKAKPAGSSGKQSCLDAAATVLKSSGKPMKCKEMIEAMAKGKLWSSDAPTPQATLSSAILREMKTNGGESRFKKVGRGAFSLKG
jgi:hypothetical protein